MKVEEPLMPARPNVYWNRLVPYARSSDLMDNLQARVADPMWMLGRQWQLGEFQGEDAGSLVDTQLITMISPLVKFRPRGDSAAHDRSALSPPDAAARDAGRARGDAAAPGRYECADRARTAAEAGTHFLRLLSDLGLAGYDTYRERVHRRVSDGRGRSLGGSRIAALRQVDGGQDGRRLQARVPRCAPRLRCRRPPSPPAVGANFGARRGGRARGRRAVAGVVGRR